MGFEFPDFRQTSNDPYPLLDRIYGSYYETGRCRGSYGSILIVILLLIPKTRKSGVYMAVALIADLIICNVILKPIVARIRPYSINQTVQLLVTPLKDYSLPSGHTAASFASVSALYFAGRKRMAAGALIVSVLIAFSRMYLYVHYPTDVLGGLIIGLLCGWIADMIIQKVMEKDQGKVDRFCTKSDLKLNKLEKKGYNMNYKSYVEYNVRIQESNNNHIKS